MIPFFKQDLYSHQVFGWRFAVLAGLLRGADDVSTVPHLLDDKLIDGLCLLEGPHLTILAVKKEYYLELRQIQFCFLLNEPHQIIGPYTGPHF